MAVDKFDSLCVRVCVFAISVLLTLVCLINSDDAEYNIIKEDNN